MLPRQEIPEGTPEENIFYVTFGVKYREETHPAGMHPDGWAVILADDEEKARVAAHVLFISWAFMYDDLDRANGNFHPELYPDGVLAIFDVRSKIK
jgi:hypothetical protein